MIISSVNNGTFVWFFIAFLLIFFLFREIFTWYFKLNRIVELLEQIEENTRLNNSVIKEEDIGDDEDLMPVILGKDKRSLFGKK